MVIKIVLRCFEEGVKTRIGEMGKEREEMETILSTIEL